MPTRHLDRFCSPNSYLHTNSASTLTTKLFPYPESSICVDLEYRGLDLTLPSFCSGLPNPVWESHWQMVSFMAMTNGDQAQAFAHSRQAFYHLSLQVASELGGTVLWKVSSASSSCSWWSPGHQMPGGRLRNHRDPLGFWPLKGKQSQADLPKDIRGQGLLHLPQDIMWRKCLPTLLFPPTSTKMSHGLTWEWSWLNFTPVTSRELGHVLL